MGNRFEDDAAIKRLSVLYALGTDAIGAGDKAAGIAYYRQAFLPDTTMKAGTLEGTGPEGWADIVERVFQQAGYHWTQHLIGSQLVTFDDANPDRARGSSYMYATHAYPDGRDSRIVLGTYYDDAVRRDGRWWVAARELISSSSEVHGVSRPGQG